MRPTRRTSQIRRVGRLHPRFGPRVRVLMDREAGAPRSRGECRAGERPCPWVGCKHHLYLDVNPNNGHIRFNFPDLEWDELEQSCSLDVADDGGHDLGVVGRWMNRTKEATRQHEKQILAKIQPRVEEMK